MEKTTPAELVGQENTENVNLKIVALALAHSPEVERVAIRVTLQETGEQFTVTIN